MGLIQLDHGSPAFPPAGTRPDAIAPGDRAHAVRARAPTTTRRRRRSCAGSTCRETSLRNAKLDPRNTIPSAASASGTNSVSVIDANASGNPVHNTTRQKISQTWLASHTGPIECAMTARGRAPRSAPPAMRSQNPAPKSAPPNSAYAVIPNIRMTATTSLTGRRPRHPASSRRRECRLRAARTARRRRCRSSPARNRRLILRRIRMRVTPDHRVDRQDHAGT